MKIFGFIILQNFLVKAKLDFVDTSGNRVRELLQTKLGMKVNKLQEIEAPLYHSALLRRRVACVSEV